MDNTMNVIIFWLVLMIILFVAEAMTQGLVTLWFGIGAFVATILAWAGVSILWQTIVFTIVSILCLLIIRKYAADRMMKFKLPVNTNMVIGKVGKVTQRIDPDNCGKVLIGDIVWQAKAKSEVIEVSEKVNVISVEGNVITVERKM